MATDKVWWVKENNLGFASLNRDTGEFTAPTEDGFCHLYCTVKPKPFIVGMSQDTQLQFDEELHDLLLWKVLQMAYERTAAGLNQAQYFNMKYDAGLKEAKKHGRSHRYHGPRQIVPQDF